MKNGNNTDYYYFLMIGSAYSSGYKTAKIDGKTYYFYFNSDGKALKNGLRSVTFGKTNNYYYFGENGRAFTAGLKNVDGTTYYFGNNGQALKDVYKTVDGTLYYFEKDGKAYNKKVYTIVLDPGHDGTHSGAVFNGVNEEVCNMKIAEAMKAELEKYKGVVVYMTHDTLECDFPDDDRDYGWGEKSELAYRVQKAADYGADYLISLHNDITANSWTSSRGLLMLYPNANYRKNCQTEAIEMGKCIVEAMDKIGISYRGNYIFDIDDGRTYPDGSTVDYYGILRNAKLRNIPAIIIEHAILNNREDNAMLQSDESLKKLGIADAAGVVSYLGLEKR